MKFTQSFCTPSRSIAWVGTFTVLLTGAWFLFSRLAFVPLPWPDGSAFYLPSLELMAWPPHWRMHTQAAFVPSYDVANFNMMPALPFLFGLGTQLGLNRLLTAPLAIKALSLVALLALAWILWQWAIQEFSKKLARKSALAAASLLGFAVLFDPILRWGTLVVRSETWIGLLWVGILIELSKPEKKLWKISAALALAAYIHFEAIILVPATVVGLWPFENSHPLRSKAQKWLKNLFRVGSVTALFLTPWFIYIVLHWTLFWEQMFIQFHRLAQANPWIESAYIVFHGLFISLGSPVSWPKFFNLGKVLFWLLLMLLAARTAYLAIHARFRSSSRVTFAAATACMSGFYLWFTKPEVWFTTLIHLTVWPWAAVVLFQNLNINPPLRKRSTLILVLCGLYAVISFGATLAQNRQIPENYSWKNYSQWIDCIEQKIEQSGKQKIWQPYAPDVLVELSSRHPEWDLTRTLDFPIPEQQLLNFIARTEVIILSQHTPVNSTNDEALNYSGPARPADLKRMKNGVEVPFGPKILQDLQNQQPSQVWRLETCQYGPFWASVALK